MADRAAGRGARHAVPDHMPGQAADDGALQAALGFGLAGARQGAQSQK